MPLVALDVDGVLVNFAQAYLDEVNERTGNTNFALDQVTNYNLVAALDLHASVVKDVAANVSSRGFCDALEPYEGARECVDEIRKFARVIAVTTPWDGDFWHREREQYLIREFGFKRSEINFVETKELFYVDALVDDKHSTILAHHAAWEDRSLSVLVDQPWNRVPVPANVHRVAGIRGAVELLKYELFLPSEWKFEETGWLVEDGATSAMWWTGTYWTTDSTQAIRFARKQDAESYIRVASCTNFGAQVIATEHRWVES